MLEYNPFAWEIHEDPYPIYRRLRDEAPVYHNPELGFYALSRWDDVWEATRDWPTYSSAQGITIEHGKPQLPMMITMDPPDHERLRSLVSRAFTPKRIASLEGYVRARMRDYVAEVGDAEAFCGVEAIANRLPMDVISTLLGVPEGERERLRDLGNRMSFRDPGKPEPPPSALAAMGEFMAALPPLVDARRENPGDDLISDLTRAEVERGDGAMDRLTQGELVAFLQLLYFAGNETTAKLLSSSLYWLWRYPAQRQILIDDPASIDPAIEELLRFDTPSQYQGRTATRDVELHGVTIPKGARVLLLTGAANRDERHFQDPDRLDVRRELSQHLSFGWGHHFCLGKSLARLEMRVALEGVLSRWPDYEIDEAGAERIHGGNVQRGFGVLPMRVGAGGAGDLRRAG
ncbi:MAG: cytochrome P450 [Deltaproteobacteria bacterium]